MNRINEIIAKPRLTHAGDLPMLKEKIKEYPFAASYHALYLLALRDSDPVKFEEELPKHSVYFNAPEYMAEYFKSTPETNTTTIDPIDFEGEKESDSTVILATKSEEDTVPKRTEEENIPQNLDEEKNLEPEEKVTEKTEEIISDEAILVENLRKIGMDHLIPVMYPDYVENQNKIIQAVEEDAKKEEGKEFAIDLTIEENSPSEPENLVEENHAEIENQEEENPISEENLEEVIKEEDTPVIDMIIEEDVSEDIEISLDEKEEESLLASITEKTNEDEHATLNTETQKDEEPKESKETQAVQNSVLFQQKQTFSQWLGLYEHKISPVKKVESETVEQFIESNPRISPIKDKNSQEVIDINAIVENDQEISHLMTETLAKLYVEQKKYSKAIEAYEILILKNPEKSSIFADRIKELKLKSK